MGENRKPWPGKFEAILEKLDQVDNRISNKSWVTFVGTVVILGIIIVFLSPVCRSLFR